MGDKEPILFIANQADYTNKCRALLDLFCIFFAFMKHQPVSQSILS